MIKEMALEYTKEQMDNSIKEFERLSKNMKKECEL